MAAIDEINLTESTGRHVPEIKPLETNAFPTVDSKTVTDLFEEAMKLHGADKYTPIKTREVFKKDNEEIQQKLEEYSLMSKQTKLVSNTTVNEAQFKEELEKYNDLLKPSS